MNLPGTKCWAWPYELPLIEKFSLFSFLSKAKNRERKTGQLNRLNFSFTSNCRMTIISHAYAPRVNVLLNKSAK